MPTITQSKTRWRLNPRDLCIAMGLFVLAVAVFANSARHDFVWDDRPVIPENPFLKSTGAWWRCFGRDFGLEITRQPAGYYRPLIFASFLANYAVGGVRPPAYHLTNILLHGLNTILMFWLLAWLAGRMAGWLGAALFAVHPVHAESVAFVAGRSDLLCAFFVLLTVLATLRSLEARRGTRAPWAVAAALAYAAALLSKELAVALPGMLLACGLIRRYRVRNLLRLCAPTAGLALIYLGFRLMFMPISGPTMPGGVPAGNLLSRAAQLLFLYAAQQTFPVIPTLGGDVLTRRLWVDAVAVVLLVLLVVAARPRRRAAEAGAWLVLFLAPTLWVNLLKGVELSDRFAYVPTAGIAALAGLAAAWYWERARLSRIVAAAVLLAFAALSVSFSAMWRNETTLWTSCLAYHPKCGRGYYNLGNAYWKEGDLTRAARNLMIATRALPDTERRCWAFANLAGVLDQAGEDALAIDAAKKAVELRPYRPSLRRLLASLLSDQNLHAEALEQLKTAEGFAPDDAGVQLDLARAYLAGAPRQSELARKAYERARALGAEPDAAIEAALEPPKSAKP